VANEKKLLAWGCGIPAACCLGCVLLGLLVAGAIGGAAWWSVKSLDVDDDALRRARAHPAVVEALGEPIERGWGFQGSLDYSGDGGSALIELPLRGPKGSGKLIIDADRRDGEWHYRRLEVRVEGGATIDLLEVDVEAPPTDAVLLRRDAAWSARAMAR
jgi:hypothetical protein